MDMRTQELIQELEEREEEILAGLDVENLVQRVMEDSTGLNKLRKLVRKVYSAGLRGGIGTKEIVGRIPSGASIGQISLFVERPILWIRPFTDRELLNQLFSWGLLSADFRRNNDPETLIEVAIENYRKANKKLGLVVAATGMPRHYLNSPLVLWFLEGVGEVQEAIPFGGLRNSFIASELIGNKLAYEELMRKGMERFGGDYYAAFRYAKIKALEKVPVLKKSVAALSEVIGSDPQGVKELYMSIYSSVYGSLLGVHPTLGGRELHPDEKSLSLKSVPLEGIVPSSFGPVGVVMRKRIAVPKLELHETFKYGKHVRRAYLKLYRQSDEIVDIEDVLEHLPERAEEVTQKVDLIANSVSFVSIALQLFTHGGGLIENLLSLSSALYYVFVYYRMIRAKRHLQSVFESLRDSSTTYVNCLVVNP
ncbi:hypothetical protein [Thermococcus sp.]